ncbi:MAG TPA: GNAT family N-acetyltransferase [Ktedonobacteraceae bacterium]
MAQIRKMDEREAEGVRDLWLQMCAAAGTPLPESSAQLILANLKQYATHQAVHCFVAEEQHILIGFVTCSVTEHPVMPGLAGEIEELYVQSNPKRQEVQAELVRQAVSFMQTRGAGSIHTRMCVGKECPEEGELRAFWRSLGWENDMTIYSIYSDVPGDPTLQSVWDEYQAVNQSVTNEQ